MRPFDKALLAVGCGCVVGGWWTRHVDIFTVGILLVVGYGIVRFIAGDPL